MADWLISALLGGINILRSPNTLTNNNDDDNEQKQHICVRRVTELSINHSLHMLSHTSRGLIRLK